MATQPTFISSLISGAGGYFKGLLAGGAFGVVAGGIIGAVVGAFTPATPVIGAIVGAELLGGLLATIGSLAGMTTHIVRSQQAGSLSTEDAVNIAKVAMAQGVSIERQRTQEEGLAQGTHWQDQHHKREADKTLAMNEHRTLQ